jgi:hypothetical protein
VVDGDGEVTVDVLSHTETVLAVAAGQDGTGKGRERTTAALKVRGVVARELEADRCDGAVCFAEEVVLEVDVLVGAWVGRANTVSWVGAVGSLGSGCCHGGGTEEGGEGEELHDVWFAGLMLLVNEVRWV